MCPARDENEYKHEPAKVEPRYLQRFFSPERGIRSQGSDAWRVCPVWDENEDMRQLTKGAALQLQRYTFPGVQRAGALGVPLRGI